MPVFGLNSGPQRSPPIAGQNVGARLVHHAEAGSGRGGYRHPRKSSGPIGGCDANPCCPGDSFPLPPSEPFLERSLALGRALACQYIVDANVFVEAGPVNSPPLADEPPASPLSCRAMKKTRVPCQRRRDGPAVGQLERQCIIGNGHLGRSDGLAINR